MLPNYPPPPHDLGAEAAVIAAMVLGGVNVVGAVADVMIPSNCYAEQNQIICSSLFDLFKTGKPIDLVTVKSDLATKGMLEHAGGQRYLLQLVNETPAVINPGHYAKTVVDKWRLRETIKTCQHVIAEAYDNVGDVADWSDSVEARFHDLATETHDDSTTETAKQTLTRVFRDIQNGKRRGLTTGLVALDRVAGELLGKQMIVIAAHSGIGKTSLAMGIALHVAMTSTADDDGNKVPHGVAVFSLEMGKEELMQRALFAKSRVDASKINAKEWMTDDDWRAVAKGATQVALDNLWIDDRAGVTPLQVRAKARRIQAEAKRCGTPLRLLVVDYAQLIKGGTGRKSESREQEVADVSRNMKSLAKELDVPVIVLAQLNEDSRKEKRRPRASDMRDSKALHHDADKVILIHNEHANERADAYRHAEEQPKALEAEEVDLIVDKNRGGRTGTARAMFWPSFTLFGDAQ
jgi:replicative DNA helicase